MFTPTSEQNDISDAAATGEDVVVEAFAGTGKTTTARKLCIDADPRRSKTYLVFNKANQREAEKTFPNDVKVRTTHALANREVRRSSYGPLLSKLSGGYVRFSETIQDLNIVPLRVGDTTVSPTTQAVATKAMIDEFCLTTDLQVTTDLYRPLPTYSDAVNASIAEAVTEYAAAAWKNLLTPEGRALRFEHKHYLKLWASGMIADGTIPTLPGTREGDLVIYDEAQDANPLMAQVMARQTHMQRIYVGDECQGINRFAGAVNAMRSFDAPHRLPLTMSWRFGPRVADAANTFLSLLGARGHIIGNKDRDSHVTDSLAADAVLCRTNAGTIGEMLTLQEQGLKVAMVGGVADAKKFVVAAEQMKKGIPNTHPELAMFPNWDALIDYVDLLDNPGTLGTLVKIVNKYGTDKLRTALADCVDEEGGGADVYCSTAHKAKGAEWNRVRLSTDFSVPMEAAFPNVTDEDDLERRDDLMLAYVAVTRGMQSINVGSLFDDDTSKRPAASITAAELDYRINVERAHDHVVAASPQDLATEFISRLPDSLNKDVTALLASTGRAEHELIRSALQSYVQMHAWG